MGGRNVMDECEGKYHILFKIIYIQNLLNSVRHDLTGFMKTWLDWLYVKPS
jgi:hypothetical protein